MLLACNGLKTRTMDAHGHCNSELLGLGRQIGQINSGDLGYFRPNYFGTVSPLSIFSIIQLSFLQKTKPWIESNFVYVCNITNTEQNFMISIAMFNCGQ